MLPHFEREALISPFLQLRVLRLWERGCTRPCFSTQVGLRPELGLWARPTPGRRHQLRARSSWYPDVGGACVLSLFWVSGLPLAQNAEGGNCRGKGVWGGRAGWEGGNAHSSRSEGGAALCQPPPGPWAPCLLPWSSRLHEESRCIQGSRPGHWTMCIHSGQQATLALGAKFPLCPQRHQIHNSGANTVEI